MLLVFAKAHHKITCRRKGGRGPGLGELPRIWVNPFNIYTVAEASDFKFGTPLGFPRPTIKPHSEEKWAWHWVTEAPIYLGFPFNIFAMVALSS